MGRPPAALLLTFLLLLTGSLTTLAQPTLQYTLTVDSSDLTGYNVTIDIHHAPQHFRLAMATHHEYDDRFWRYVTNFKVELGSGIWIVGNQPLFKFARTDSAVWTVTAPIEEVRVSYRISLPPPGPLHFSHRPFLTPTGGLVGDLHSFMYLVEAPHAPCWLTLYLPLGWEAATGLDKAPHYRIVRVDRNGAEIPNPSEDSFYLNQPPGFKASGAPQLLDAPILVGRLHRWHFTINGIPHEVAYLAGTPALSFDTAMMVVNIQKIVIAANDIFRNFPYKHYTFLFEDASAGALEHRNSVTIGITATDITAPKQGIYEEIAHEFFHTWNLMAIRPSGYTELNYGTQQQSPNLWFSEGVTMFYADLICRRTGLPVDESTRIEHLTSLITRYYRDTGNVVLPPSRVSLASNLQPGSLGDYSASTHLQGELLGSCLDLLIRNATDGRHTLDDLMRQLYAQRANPITDSMTEAATTAVCQCTFAHAFFHQYLYYGRPINPDAYLRQIGLVLRHDQPPAIDSQGRPLPDTRVYTWVLRDDTSLRIGISNPQGCWAKAGLHTGDIITAIDALPVHSRQDFQSALRILHIGDTAIITTQKKTGMTAIPVYITGFTTPLITITDESRNAGLTARMHLYQWAKGAH